MIEQALANANLTLAAAQLKILQQKITSKRWQNFPDIYRLQARLLQLQGKFALARIQFDRFLTLRPQAIPAHHHRIEVMLALGQLPEARKLYSTLVRQSRGNLQTIYQQLYAHLLPPRTAIDYLRQLATTKPDLALHLTWCSSLLKEGEYATAARIIQSLKTDDRFIHAKLLGWQGYAQVMTGRRQAGEQVLQQLRQQPHGQYYGLVGLVYSWLAQKKYDQAIAAWQEAMRCCQKNKTSYCCYAPESPMNRAILVWRHAWAEKRQQRLRPVVPSIAGHRQLSPKVYSPPANMHKRSLDLLFWPGKKACLHQGGCERHYGTESLWPISSAILKTYGAITLLFHGKIIWLTSASCYSAAIAGGSLSNAQNRRTMSPPVSSQRCLFFAGITPATPWPITTSAG